MVRAALFLLVAASAAMVACSLNPQPLPPEDTNGFGADAGTSKDSSPTTGDATGPTQDGGADIDGAVLDAGSDASDAGDASDASDGGADGGDAALDAVSE